MEKYTYEVWVLGYDVNDEPTDIEVYLGAFKTAGEAVAHAKKFYDLGCAHGLGKVVENLDEGDYLQVRVEQCVDNEEDGTECIDVLIDVLYEAELR